MTTRNVCIALALISAAACGGGGGGGGGGGQSTGPPPPPGNTPPLAGGISVTNNTFTPATMTVTPGTTVQWAWNTCTGGGGYGDEVCVAHGVNFDDGTNSLTQEKGTYSRTFTVANTTYNYHCAVHGPAMAGSIIVQ